MPGRKEPLEADFERTRSILSEGLRACRAMVRDYRDLLADDSGGASHPPPDNDEQAPAGDSA